MFRAQLNLGVAYTGRGVRQNFAEAVKWLRKAAEQGHASAQLNLGVMYVKYAKGGQDDDVLAHQWFNLAAATGNAKAAEYRDDLAKLMTRDQIAEAQRLAREWKPKPERP